MGKLNCKGLTDEKKRKDVFNQLRQKRKKNLTYIVCRRNTFKTVKENKQSRNPNGALNFFFLAAWIAKVVGSLFHLTVHSNNVLQNVICDQQGQFIALEIYIFQQRCTLVALYGPNTDSPEFYINLKENLHNRPFQLVHSVFPFQTT